MYFLYVHVGSDCSLARSTDDNESKIIVGNIYGINGSKNSIMAYSLGSDIMDQYSRDFESIKFIKGKYMNMLIGTKRGHGIMDSILASGGIPVYPFIAHDGGESYNILHLSRSSLMKNLELIEKNNKIYSFDYNFISSGEDVFNLTRKLSMDFTTLHLTDTERKVIREALNRGYLDWPRSINLNDLAEEFKISKPSVLLHIRNAEKKIISSFLSR